MAGGNGVTNSHFPGQPAQLARGEDGSPPMTAETPILQISPINLSVAQLRWIVSGIIGAIWSAYAAGWLFLPAKDVDLQTLRTSFEIVQKEQIQARDALVRLTTAVDNLSGLVDRLGNAPQQLQRLVPLVPRGAVRRVTPR